MNPAASRRAVTIRTPDQRLRVFVSSTLRELADERRAARAAIERLRMAPVMFELGARPHPPRELYRAYLQQSDIFVGLYCERYGWVSPGEEVSGLEDEYNLAPPAMPRLIYIKETGGTREPRLVQLLDRIRSDDRAAFKYFSDAGELTELLAADLAVLLAERFDVTRGSRVPAAPPQPPVKVSSPTALPALLTRLLGREREVESIVALLRAPAPRLLTLTGPGGIGKTRLAIEAARKLEADFPDGVRFVRLAHLEDAAQVPVALADALGVQNTGDAPLEDRILTAVRDRRMLLLLDNFEQVLDAAPFIKDIVGGAPGLKVLVTSRSLLRVLGEQSLEVTPLELPAPRSAPWGTGAPLAASVELLVERARAVKPDFEITPDNVADVEAIAARLEGVPLAIELAAARLRLLTPADLLARLDRRLALLVGGSRNLPPRQQALRTTIEWSTRLLGPREQRLLWRLGVFAGRFSLEAVECLVDDPDALMSLETLVDNSLVRQQELNYRTYFLMLTVREYALERLEQEGAVAEVRRRHAEYYRDWAQRLSSKLVGPGQRGCVAVLSSERDNLRAAELYLLGVGDWSNAAELAWSVWPYWWIGGMMGEFRRWMETVLASGDPLPDRVRAIALAVTRASLFWDRPTPAILAELEESAGLFERLGSPSDAGIPLIWLAVAYAAGDARDLARAAATVERGLADFRAEGNRWGESVLLTGAARLQVVRGDMPGALATFESALAIARESGNDLAILIGLHYVGWARLLMDDLDGAVGLFSEALELSPALQHDEGVAWDLEGFTGIAAVIGDAERAGLLAGAAESLRERIGMPDTADAVFHGPFVERLRQSPAAAQFDGAFERGRRMPTPDAVAVAWEVARSVGARAAAHA